MPIKVIEVNTIVSLPYFDVRGTGASWAAVDG